MSAAPTIAALAASLAAGRTTSVALTEDALARIAQHQRAGGVAFLHGDADGALAQARAADQARAAGLVASPLAGLPVSIKDLFDVRGQLTRAGSVALEDTAPAQADAPAVAQVANDGLGAAEHGGARRQLRLASQALHQIARVQQARDLAFLVQRALAFAHAPAAHF